MARRRIPAVTAELRGSAKTGRHGKGRHPISKKDREAFRRHYEYHLVFCSEKPRPSGRGGRQKGCFECQDSETVKVAWSEEDQEFVGLSEEFPSLSWLAPTWVEALRGIKRLVSEIKNDINKK